MNFELLAGPVLELGIKITGGVSVGGEDENLAVGAVVLVDGCIPHLGLDMLLELGQFGIAGGVDRTGQHLNSFV